MNRLPSHIFVATPIEWEICLDDLFAQTQIALDLESNSMFAYRERICLIQISTREHDYIVDPLVDLDWAPLGELIENQQVEKILHASEYDLILMQREHGWQLRTLFDTMWAARILGYERIGLASMLELLYEVRLDKKYQRANWCERPLSKDKLAYAQRDTHYLFQLRDDLNRMLEQKGLAQEATEIFAEQATVRIPDTSFDPESFWSLNGVRNLTPQQKAILRELNIFRDQESSKRNRPAFKVLSNRTLLEIAALGPKRFDQLNQVHGMSDRQIQRYGHAIMSVVRRGKSMPIPKQVRRPRLPEAVVSRYDRLHLWRKNRALERGVSSDVILNRDQMWALAKAAPQTLSELEAMPELGDWRKTSYGAELVDLLLKH